MFGKHFESMYDGSMYGAGVAVFAVWGYVVAHTRKSRVELNPRKLSDTLGGTVEEIEKAIEFLTSPDANSRNKEHGGRRLVKEGEFQYFLPSWEFYQGIRDADARREYNRLRMREHRAKKKPGGGPSAREVAYVKGVEEGKLDKYGVPVVQETAVVAPETPGVPHPSQVSNPATPAPPEKGHQFLR